MGVMLRAVVVGINDYRNPRNRLRFASNDAFDFAEFLHRSTTFSVESIKLLRDKEATRRAVWDNVENTFSSRGFDSNTIALFYFAGHGIVNDSDKRILLGCQDVDASDPHAGSIRLNDIYDLLLSTSAECVIAIIDACFSGGLVAGDVNHRGAAERAMQAIELLRHKEGKTIAIFAACTSEEAARERQTLGHGIFTYEILRGWRDGAAQGKDGKVSLASLLGFLQQDATKFTQTPQMSIRGSSRPVLLWAVEQSNTLGASPLASPPPAPHILPSVQPSRAGMVFAQPKLPTSSRPQTTHIQERNRLIALFGAIAFVILLILSLIIYFIVHIFVH